MKYKHIIWLFCVIIPISVIARIYQLFVTINPQTGFFLNSQKKFGFYITVGLCCIAIISAIIGATVRRDPRKMPRVNAYMGISSFLLSIGMIYELFGDSFSVRSSDVLTVLFSLFGFVSAIFFAVYSAKMLVHFHIPGILFVIPVIYCILKLIRVFTSVSALALVTDNILLLLFYCAFLVFLLEFEKLQNGIDRKYITRKLLASSLSTVVLGLVNAIPAIIWLVKKQIPMAHQSIPTTVICLFASLFVAAFTFGTFSNKNLSKHKHRHHTTSIMDIEKKDNFYINYHNN